LGGGLHPPALDELGHDRRRVVERRDDRGGNPDPRRALVGDPLGAPIDAEQRGVLAGNPHDAVAIAETHAEVLVRDPAVEGHGLALRLAQHRRQALEDLGDFGQFPEIGVDGRASRD
jgi:hypothetical protein